MLVSLRCSRDLFIILWMVRKSIGCRVVDREVDRFLLFVQFHVVYSTEFVLDPRNKEVYVFSVGYFPK
jgi:hypothetical protein